MSQSQSQGHAALRSDHALYYSCTCRARVEGVWNFLNGTVTIGWLATRIFQPSRAHTCIPASPAARACIVHADSRCTQIRSCTVCMRSPRTVEMHYGTLRRGLPVGSSSSRCHHAVEISSRSQPPRASDPRDPIRILVKFFMICMNFTVPLSVLGNFGIFGVFEHDRSASYKWYGSATTGSR